MPDLNDGQRMPRIVWPDGHRPDGTIEIHLGDMILITSPEEAARIQGDPALLLEAWDKADEVRKQMPPPMPGSATI